MNKEKEIIDSYISQATTIGIVSHKNPDDDAITSTLAVKWYIDKYFPEVASQVIFSGKTQNRWDYLIGANQVHWVDDISNYLNNFDLLIFLDGSSLERFTDFPGIIESSKIKTLCIDHHIESDAKFTEVIRKENAAACAQIIAETLFGEEDLKDKGLSKILLVGIYDDSGNLTYITKESFSIFDTVKKILEISGLNVQEILTEKSEFTPENFSLFRELVQNTKSITLNSTLPPLTYSYYNDDTHKNFDEGTLSYVKKYYANVVLRMIRNHTWGFVLTPLENHISISFRSSPGGPNVQKICSDHYEGGGHLLTASGKIDKKELVNIEQLSKKILDDLECMDIAMTTS